MKKKVFSILFILILVFALKSTCQAASASIICKDTATVGETINISATVNAVQWKLELKVNGQTIATTNEVNNIDGNISTVFSGSYTPTSEGTLTVTLEGSATDMDESTVRSFGSKTITVKAAEVPSTPEQPEQPQEPTNPETPAENPNSGTTTNNQTPTATTKSKEARLKDLGITPNDFKGFKQDTFEYSVEVPNNISEVSVYAKTKDSKAKVTGTGKISLKEGENTAKVVVTAEDGTTTKTYTIKITRQASEVTEPTPTEEPQEPETPVEEPEKEVLGLSTLSIKDLNLSPKFSTEKYEYTVGLTEDLSSLEIEAKANSETATVEIVGNEDLKQGENIITILVSNAETEESATYQIVVNKNVKTTETVGKVEWLKPSTWGLKEKIIVAVVAVLVVVIIVAVIIKIRLSRYGEDDEMDFPGADELDRALAEHQELTDDSVSFENEYNPENYSIDDFYIKNDKESNMDKMENKTQEITENNNYVEDKKIEPENNFDFDQDYYGGSSRRKGKHF